MLKIASMKLLKHLEKDL